MILIPLFLLLVACGDNNNDTIWTGLSGVILFGIIAIVVLHVIRGRNK